jgi:hypothetical protein
MSGNRHIVSKNNTNTDGKNMIEIFTSNLHILMPALWACFTIYIAWYTTKAKHYSTITPLEAKQLWTIHKQDTHCNGRKWRQIERAGKTIGFQCECGHRHTQKRPIVAHLPTTTMEYEASAFDRLHTTHKSA